ncbi:MAG: hypothetical protein ACRD5H_11755, partial [Nitrososphaerales archaeon]
MILDLFEQDLIAHQDTTDAAAATRTVIGPFVEPVLIRRIHWRRNTGGTPTAFKIAWATNNDTSVDILTTGTLIWESRNILEFGSGTTDHSPAIVMPGSTSDNIGFEIQTLRPIRAVPFFLKFQIEQEAPFAAFRVLFRLEIIYLARQIPELMELARQIFRPEILP